MLNFLAMVSLVIVVALAAILIPAAAKPNDFRVRRNIAVTAPPKRAVAAHDTAEFAMLPQADNTTSVTWAMYGPATEK